MGGPPAHPHNPPMPRQLKGEAQLLVEGRDLEGFCSALIQDLGLEGVEIQNFGGINQLRPFLGAFVKMEDFPHVTSLGVIRDAETDAARALESVRGCLERVELPVPAAVGERADGRPGTAVMILPGNNRAGMLETLLCETFVD